jgi:carbonic anhydrase
MPHLRDWIRIALPVKEIMDKHYAQVSLDFRNRIAEKENILAQLRNIQTYPFVAKALEEGKLYLHGWYYDIGTGNISSYNPVTDTFEMIG